MRNLETRLLTISGVPILLAWVSIEFLWRSPASLLVLLLFPATFFWLILAIVFAARKKASWWFLGMLFPIILSLSLSSVMAPFARSVQFQRGYDNHRAMLKRLLRDLPAEDFHRRNVTIHTDPTLSVYGVDYARVGGKLRITLKTHCGPSLEKIDIRQPDDEQPAGRRVASDEWGHWYFLFRH